MSADSRPTLSGDAYRPQPDPRGTLVPRSDAKTHGFPDLEPRADSAAGHLAEHARLAGERRG